MRNRSKQSWRARVVERVRIQLQRGGYPRLEMTVIVSATGLAGLLSSFALLQFGLGSMGIRYAISVLAAYAVFLILIYLWLQLFRPTDDLSSIDLSDLVDNVDDVRTNSPSFDIGDDVGVGGSSDASSMPAESGHDSGLGGLDFDFEDAILIAFVSAIALSVLVAAGYIIYDAPLLLAEVVVDGAFSATLYRRLRRVERRHWLERAVLRTRFPILFVFVSFTIAGFVMDKFAPDADSIGGVVQTILNN